LGAPLLKELGRPDLYDDFAYSGKFPNDPAKIFRYIDILECPSDPQFDESTMQAPLSYAGVSHW
jgi:hypothetical protein